MYVDETQISFEVMKINKELSNYEINPELVHQIEKYLESNNTFYYPYGGFTYLEMLATRLYPNNATYYFSNLVIGKCEGIRYRRCDVHYVHEFYNDGTIQDEFKQGVKQYDSILYEFNFDFSVKTDISIKAKNDDQDREDYMIHKNIQKLEGFQVYEYYKVKETYLTPLNAASVLLFFSTGTNSKIQSQITYYRNRSFNITQFFSSEFIQAFTRIKDMYKGNIELAFSGHNLYLKILDRRTFDLDQINQNKVSESTLNKIEKEINDIVILAINTDEDVFTRVDKRL